MDEDPTGDARAPARGGRQGVRAELRALLELLGLSALAVTQPVLDVFADGSDVFLVRRASRLDILLFTAAVALGPALVLWLGGTVIGLLGSRPRRLAHLVSLGLLGGAAAIQLVKELAEPPAAVVLALAVASGLLVILLVARLSPARTWLRLLSLATAVFVTTFLLSPSVRPLLGDEGSGGAGAVGRPAPVVFVVMDELPTMSLLDGEGRIDRDLFPNFARLADASTWYRNHTASAASTSEAVPALMTGTFADESAPPPTAAVYPDNLFSLLGDDYQVRAREVITRLCPDAVCSAAERRASTMTVQRSLLGTARDVLVDRLRPSDTPEAAFTVDPLPDEPDPAGRMQQFVAGLGPSEERPRFDFLHVLLPHQPFNFLPSGKRYDSPELLDGQFAVAWLSQSAAEAARVRHLLNLQLADREVGRLLDRLEQLGTYDETLLVLTSDHGVSFLRNEPMRTLDEQTYPELLWTPLFVKEPGQRAGRLVEDPVRSVDVLPTVAELLDVELPFETDGRPASEAGGEAPTRVRALESHGGVSQPAEASYREFDLEAGYRTVLDSAAAPNGEAGDPLRLHRIGAHPDLVGQAVGPLRGPGADGAEVVLEGPSTVAYDPAGSSAPVYVRGTLEGNGGDAVLAVALDGRVAATTTMVPGDPRFWAVLPESLLVPGDNELELFLVEGEPGAERLRALPVRDGG